MSSVTSLPDRLYKATSALMENTLDSATSVSNMIASENKTFTTMLTQIETQDSAIATQEENALASSADKSATAASSAQSHDALSQGSSSQPPSTSETTSNASSQNSSTPTTSKTQTASGLATPASTADGKALQKKDIASSDHNKPLKNKKDQGLSGTSTKDVLGQGQNEIAASTNAGNSRQDMTGLATGKSQTPALQDSQTHQTVVTKSASTDPSSPDVSASTSSTLTSNVAVSALVVGVSAKASSSDSSTTADSTTPSPSVDPQNLSLLSPLVAFADKRVLTSNGGDVSLTSGTGKSLPDQAGSLKGTVLKNTSDNGLNQLQDALTTKGEKNPAETQTSTSNASNENGSQNVALSTVARDTQAATTPLSSATSNSASNSLAGQLNVLEFLNAPTASPVVALGTAALNAPDENVGSAGQEGMSTGLGNGQSNANAALSVKATTASAETMQNIATSKATGPYSFASQLTALRSSSAGLATAVDQVALQLNRNVKNGNDEMSLQLNPADLGRVNIKLDITSDGKVTGTVTAENPATLDMLSKDSRSLERSLQDAGFQADPGSLQFSMSGQSGGAFGQTAQNTSSASNLSGSKNLEASAESLAATAVTETYYITPNGVNLSV